MWRSLAVVVAAAAGIVPAATDGRAETGAPAFVIQGDHVIAGVAMGRGTVTQAVTRFGVPTLKRSRPPSCLITWPRLGLTIDFLDFAGRPCRDGGPVVATVTNRSRWRTALGLRVGDGVPRLRTLFPRASRRRGLAGGLNGFWLVTRRACEEVGGHAYPGLLARIRNGRVSAIVVRAGVCE